MVISVNHISTHCPLAPYQIWLLGNSISYYCVIRFPVPLILMTDTQCYRKCTQGVFLQTEGWTLIVSVMSTHDVMCYVVTNFEYFKLLNQSLKLNFFFFSSFKTYTYCWIALWPVRVVHTKACYWTRYQTNSIDIIYSQSVIISNLRLY
jgi:hypothetical protein